MRGKKTGGRKAGTKNKDRSEIFRELYEHHPNLNILLKLLEIAENSTNEAIKYNCYKEVAKYTLPQLKAIAILEEEGKMDLPEWLVMNSIEE